jgi:uncharacterized protein YgbK (DUF1537 family)
VAAYDSETRETADPAPAMRRWAPYLRGSELAFKKIDSLLRGAVGAELAACVREGQFVHAIVAPAFPAQGRITSGGRQYAHGADTGIDLAFELELHGMKVSHCRPGDPPSPGVSLWDAIDDADLDLIAAAGRRLAGPVLWCGTGGLAAALAGRARPPSPRLPRPILALVGSDHPATRAQFAATPVKAMLRGVDGARALAPSLSGASVALRVDVAAGMERAAAANEIATTFAALAFSIPRPGTLCVSGGDTLRRLCDKLETQHLAVLGEYAPGVPISSIEGGVWDGVTLVSKSGAFGRPDFLSRLFAA